MLGLMQSQPLLISSLIEFAERHHGDVEIVSRRVEKASRQGQQAFGLCAVQHVAAVAASGDQQVFDALPGGGEGKFFHPQLTRLTGKVAETGMLAVGGVVQIEFERGDRQCFQSSLGFGWRCGTQSFVVAQEAAD